MIDNIFNKFRKILSNYKGIFNLYRIQNTTRRWSYGEQNSEVVEQIRTSSDIVEVIGEYVQLRKQGRNYFGLCPFHGENSPSFSVSSDKQIFHCFGCGEGGNVFSFLMKMEGLAFTEAVQKLGERNGIAVAEYTSGQGQQEDISDDTVIMQQAHELLKSIIIIY